ncbi:MAG: hypothetical protein ACE5GM_04615 [bacterium]
MTDSSDSPAIDPIYLGWLIFGGLLLVTGLIIYHSYNNHDSQTKKLLQEKARIEKLISKYSRRKDYSKENATLLDDLRELEKRQDNWWYLRYLEEVGVGDFKPRYTTIGFAKVIEGKDFVRVTKEVALSARYEEIVRLITQLENIGGFEIQDLSIRESTTESGIHRVKFKLTSLEVKKSLLKKLRQDLIKGITKQKSSPYKLALLIEPKWKSRRKKKIRKVTRDPFVNIKRRREEWLAALKERINQEKERKETLKDLRSKRERQRLSLRKRRLEEERKRAYKKAIAGKKKIVIPPPINISLEMEMVGYFDFKSGKIALIKPDNYVRVGNVVDGMKVVKIEPRKITFKKGIQEYYSSMEIMGIPVFGSKKNNALKK